MLARDFSYAFRTLIKSPAFLATAVVTIGLGIGASTAIFSVVNAVLLRPLPYTAPERLVLVQGDLRARNVRDFPFAPGDYNDLRREGTLFDGFAAVNTFPAPLTTDGGPPEQIRVAQATTNFFTLMGLRVALGRNFADDDGTPQPPPPVVQNAAQPGTAAPAGGQPAAPAAQPPRAPAIAILSHAFWKRRFGGDSAILGKSIDLGPRKALVVGVLEPGAELLFPANMNVDRIPDLWSALQVNFDTASRINVFMKVVGRLKKGVPLSRAQAQIDNLAADLRQRFPIKNTAGFYLRLEPMQANLVAAVKPALLALMGAVLFVLLIACANVANLLLVRASQRERELVLRAALGGSQWALLRQMMAESLMLAGAGAALGLGLAALGIQLLKSLGPRDLPRLDTVGIDPVVLGFAVLAAVVAALVFGVVPALRASRPDASEALRTAGRSPALRAGRTFRNGVVVAEVALSFVLLIGTGLMFRSFLAVLRTDPGYDAEGVLTLLIQNPRLRTPEAQVAYQQQLSDRLKGLPGVQSVTSVFPLPLDGNDSNVRWGTEAAEADPKAFHQGQAFFVQPGYFETLRTQLLSGRTLTTADIPPPPPPQQPGAPAGNATPPGPPGVIVVDSWLAAKAFPGQSAIGKRLLIRVGGPTPDWFEIVGVVAHQRHTTLTGDEREIVFFPATIAGGRWVIRTAGDPARMGPAVRAAITALDPLVPVAEMKPMTDYLDRARAPTRFALVLIGLFAIVAAVLTAVGLYGVLSSVVRQRTAEIGVRMAFGAPRATIFRLVIGQGLRLSGLGIAAGVVGALWLTQGMRKLLVGVKATDPVTFVSMAGVFLVIAAAACWLPARRASALDPTVALREE